MNIKIIKRFLVFLAALLGTVAVNASAATLSLIPEGQLFGVGREFSVNLVLNTEDVNVNAAQATIRFPSNILQLVSVDRSKSSFNFWVEEPIISNTEGTMQFIGGTSRGISGNNFLVLSMRFKASGAGKAEITLSDSIVTASDGKGTNVLSSTKGANISVSTSIEAPEPAPTVQEQPEKIVREPALAKGLPALPQIRAALYPDQDKWYNQIGDIIALWEVPEDITQIAAALDQNPKTTPTKFDKELFNGQNFGPLAKEGVWYVHVRFKNNIGAGPTTHYKISVDTTPPLPFEIEALGGLKIEGAGITKKIKTDNPQPVLRFQTGDALSGMSHYAVIIGDQESILLEQGELKFPLQSPGQRTVTVRAVDKAGNMAEAALDLEILPIASPTISFIKKDIFVGEGGFLIQGTALEGLSIKLFIRKEAGDVVAEGMTEADAQGNWEAVIDQPLKKGWHFVEVVAQDARGALSLPVKSDLIKVRAKPLLTIAGLGITQFWFFLGLVLILIGGFVAGWLTYQARRTQIGRRAVVAQRDITTAFNLIEGDIEKMLALYADKRIDKREASEMEFLLKKIKDNLGKMQKYIIENIGEIPD